MGNIFWGSYPLQLISQALASELIAKYEKQVKYLLI